MNINKTTYQPITPDQRPADKCSPSVLLVGKQGAADAPGGGETQMAAMAKALPSAGVEARLRDAREDPLAGVDCLHLFGSLPEYLPLVASARRRNIPVVLSTIAWFEWINSLREPWPWWRRMAACGKFFARALYPKLPSWRRELYHAVDLLLPNSNAEAQQLARFFAVPLDRIHIVPNGADPRFAAADPKPFADLVGCRDYVLCAGRIEPRKNQLAFLRAMHGSRVPVVVLGDVVPGAESYFAQCRQAADADVQFIPRIEHGDPLLASAYAACGCLVLASWFETPGLAALEAAMTGTPLVLPVGGSAAEYFGPLAAYVRPNDLRGIRRAVLSAGAGGRSEALAGLAQNNFTWAAAARATREAYGIVL